MRTIDAVVVLLENEDEAKQYLRSIGVKGPSLHPRVHAESTRNRWNGWNYAKAAGVDALDYPLTIESWHFASGWIDFSGTWANETGRLGSGAFDSFNWPITVFRAIPIIQHPEHTPTEEAQ